MSIGIHVDTSEFESAHGRKPRGWGMWAFDIDGEVFWHTGLYSEGKDFAQRMAGTRNADSVKVRS